jgi:class 3 adenylate cyclase
MHPPPSLERHGPLGRFDASTEVGYGRWLVLRIRSHGAMMAAASLAAWLVVPIVGDAMLPAGRGVPALYGVCWGIFVPMLVGMLVYLRRSGTLRWIIQLATLGVAVTSLGSLLLLGPALDDLSSAYLATGIFFASIGPLVLLPFAPTLVLGVATFAAALGQAVSHHHGPWDVSLSVMSSGAGISSLVVGPAMAFASERWLREAYANELTIAHQRQLLRRFAPSSVVSRIELGDATVSQPQRRRVTVLFCDVVGFTTMADRVDPEGLAEIVNDYLGNVSALIERHGGTVNEFAGDGVMAIFGAPEQMDPRDQVLAAVAAAQELQGSLPEWSQDWYQHGIVSDAQARIGINTGMVSVGTFGSAVRATYTGIGLQTNIAARVQAEAEPGGILLSNTSWHLVKDRVACEPRGEVLVKGVHFPIELYAPASS